MSIYSSDYNDRTREIESARKQKAREVAVTSAAQVLSATLSPDIDTSTGEIAAKIIEVAESLRNFIVYG